MLLNYDVTMCKLSKQEKDVLELRLTSADDKIVAAHLGISPSQVRVIKSRVKKKRDAAKSLLTKTKKYKEVLYPRRRGE